MNCPRCNKSLKSTEYDGAQIEICPGCKGEWLAAGELLQLVEHHEELFTPKEIEAIDAVNEEIFTAEKDDHDELDCPVCERNMEHFNYGETSGIILHRCNKCSGIWTDGGQLQELEALVDGWKSHLDQDSEQYGAILQKVEQKEQADLDQSVSISRFGFVNAVLRHFCE